LGNIIFIKPTGKSLPDYVIQAGLTGSLKRHKKQRKEELMRTNPEIYGQIRSISSKKGNQRAFCAQRTRDKNFVRSKFKRELVFLMSDDTKSMK
jgi:hypothetical protein